MARVWTTVKSITNGYLVEFSTYGHYREYVTFAATIPDALVAVQAAIEAQESAPELRDDEDA